MIWQDLVGAGSHKIITLLVLLITFSFILFRKINIAFISLIAASTLVIVGILSPKSAILGSIDWNVLAIYWGYGMLAFSFQQSGLPVWFGQAILKRVRKEKHVLILLCTLAAILSSFMANPVVVIILAPLVIRMAEDFNGDLFVYLVGLAISSNVVTTVTMIADPPSLIMASRTGMKFFDFYWFQGKLGLGTISILGVVTALLILFYRYRNLKKEITSITESIGILSKAPLIIFVLSVVALGIPFKFAYWPGLVGLSVGGAALTSERRQWKNMIKDFDWNSILFLIGIFVVISAVERVGLLKDLANAITAISVGNAAIYLAIFVWLSVLLSSFIDNVPYTILMIPVCASVAGNLGVSPFPFYFGMLVGTGIGGNITPVGATANVLACGMLEKKGYRIDIKKYLAISVPFSVGAVLVGHVLIHMIWL